MRHLPRLCPACSAPAPAPPRTARPRSLSVTQIEKLVRDPFAIYAQKVLGLTPLDPLRPAADARLRGTILHAILRRFVEETPDGLPEDAEDQLIAVARQELADAADWPVARHLWMAAITGAARAFVTREAERRTLAEPWRFEIRGEADFAPLKLRGTADRIDRLPDGRLAIYDYKSGTLPTEKVERMFNQQLRLEAAMAVRGAFGEPADYRAGRLSRARCHGEPLHRRSDALGDRGDSASPDRALGAVSGRKPWLRAAAGNAEREL